MTQPTMGKAIISALDELEQIINTERADYSNRTSVHVHIDIRDMSVDQLFNMLYFYIYCEKAIFNYVGEGREENNYCIPWWKTEELKTHLYNIYQALEEDNSDQIQYILNEQMNKYSALNLRAITRFGSVEFRHHYGTHDKHRILEWINILMSLKKQAMEVDHTHVSFDELVNEHFQIPEALDIFMTEPVTYKGMTFLNEIYHDCKLFSKQARERENLSRAELRGDGRCTRPQLKQFDIFNQQRELSNLRPTRRPSDDGSLDEEDINLLVGGSVLLRPDSSTEEQLLEQAQLRFDPTVHIIPVTDSTEAMNTRNQPSLT